jgi:K+-sensing histidine kinase KdpD
MSTKDSADSEDELLGDLESLRSILDEEDELAPQDDEAVPLLDDVVADAADAEEPSGAGPGGMDDDLFQALLSDDWRKSAAAIIEQAAAALGQADAWTPQEIAAIQRALRLEQNETLNQWISDALDRHADALRAELLEAFSGELKPALEGILRRVAGGDHGE